MGFGGVIIVVVLCSRGVTLVLVGAIIMGMRWDV